MHIVEDSTEYPTIITKINMPFMYARRVIVNTFYPKFDQQTGSQISISSSLLNEQIRDEAMVLSSGANRAVINDEVVAFNHINYVKVEPIPG